MKTFFCFLLILAFQISAHATYYLEPSCSYSCTSINGGLYKLDAPYFHRFDIYEGNSNIRSGYVDKLNERTRTYRLFLRGQQLSTMYSPFFSLGSLMDSLKTFEVLDEQDNSIGQIVGKFFTSNPSKFDFYDKQGKYFCTASLNRAYSQLTFQNIEGENLVLCNKSFSYKVGGWFEDDGMVTRNYWRIDEVSSSSIDPRFFWPFLSFIAEVWWSGVTE